MPCSLVKAQSTLNSLAGLTTNAVVGQIVGHAFADHMSKANALAAAINQHVAKGYYEIIKSTTINTVDQFLDLNPKDKTKVFAGYANKKKRDLGKHVINKKPLVKTDTMNAGEMAILIVASLKSESPDCRVDAQEDRFLLFTPVPAGYVARSVDEHNVKVGGGGIDSPGLPWSVLVIIADGGNSKVISAYPSDDAYRVGRNACA